MLNQNEIMVLATYNSEVGRGIAHTGEYVSRMSELQRRFDNPAFVIIPAPSYDGVRGLFRWLSEKGGW
jgi:hypothetical protein